MNRTTKKLKEGIDGFFLTKNQGDDLERLYNQLTLRLLLVGILASIVLCATFLLQGNYTVLVGSVLVLGAETVGLTLLRKGYSYRPIIGILITSVLLANYGGAFVGEGVNDFGLHSASVIMILVAMFFGEGWLVRVSILNVSIILFLYAAQETGLMTFKDRAYPTLGAAAVAIAINVVLVFILRFTLKQLILSNEKMKIAKEEAERANQLKSRFLANMSHELRTPLHAIIGYSEMVAELLQETKELPEGVEEDVHRITQSGNHLLRLITDILDLSKAEANQLKIYNDWFNLAELIEEVSNTLKPLNRQNNNQLIVENNTDTPQIFTDRMRLKQILINLLSNATRFTKDGTIRLTLLLQNQSVEFAVEDNGIGIDKDQLEEIFEPFQQIDDSLTRKYQGTGLGLAISRTLIDQMGGNLAVTSELKKGSRFYFQIPTTPAAISNWVESPLSSGVDATRIDDLA